jgi:hypothetical protein
MIRLPSAAQRPARCSAKVVLPMPDDVLIVMKDGDGELVLAQMFPDVLHRIEFWRVGGQRQQGDVVWRLEIRGGVISSAIEGEDGVRPACNFFADFGQMKRKRFGVGMWQDESGRRASRRTNRPEDIGPFVAQLARAAAIPASPKSASACPADRCGLRPGTRFPTACHGRARPERTRSPRGSFFKSFLGLRIALWMLRSDRKLY